MDPIDVRADTNFHHALRCVEYRPIHTGNLKPAGYTAAIATRYGLIGSAAAYNLLLTSPDDPTSTLEAEVGYWQELVEDHMRTTMSRHAPFAINLTVPTIVGRFAGAQMRAFLMLYRRRFSFADCLEMIGQVASAEHKGMICEGWPWYRRRQAMRHFRELRAESARFATNFFERRQAGLEEVPEIALLGE